MLDPLAQPERRPGVARRLERVERVAVREVADRVHGDGQPGLGRAPDDLLELLALVIWTPEPSSIRAVCEPSVPSMNTFR